MKYKLMSLITVFAFAGVLVAQSPFAGTWKLDTAKSKYTTGQPPKELTLVIEEQGDNLVVNATGVNPDGSPLSVKYTVPVQGGTGQMQSGQYDSIHVKSTSPTVRENTYSKNGRDVMSRRMTVSADGKTMTSVVKGTNAAGNTVAGTDRFDKQ